MKTSEQETWSELKGLMPVDPYHSEFATISKTVCTLNTKRKQQILELCNKVLNDENLRRFEYATVSCARLLVALCPLSENSIRYWINTRKGKYIYEVHFSLFCYLDELIKKENCEQISHDIPLLISDYLASVKREVGSVIYMACDLLGDHWSINESFPYLMKSAETAKYSDARMGAIDGLSKLFKRLDENDQRKKEISLMLENISRNDRSARVRRHAKYIISVID